MSTEVKGLPVSGYRAQPSRNVELVNDNKAIEERVLRMLDSLAEDPDTDKRWLAIAKTQIEQGFMAMNRAIFKPSRIDLPQG